MGRPVVGICTHLEQVRWSVWEDRADVTGGDLVSAVQSAGAQALLIPADPALAEDPSELLERIDGLVVEAREDDCGGDGWPEALRARVEAAGIPVFRAVTSGGNGSPRSVADSAVRGFVESLGR
jgi:hypothetical protein